MGHTVESVEALRQIKEPKIGQIVVIENEAFIFMGASGWFRIVVEKEISSNFKGIATF